MIFSTQIWQDRRGKWLGKVEWSRVSTNHYNVPEQTVVKVGPFENSSEVTTKFSDIVDNACNKSQPTNCDVCLHCEDARATAGAICEVCRNLLIRLLTEA